MKEKMQINLIKGIGISLMVLGHCGFPFTNYIYLFHMAIFFIASGYCFNHKYSDNFDGIKTIIKKRLKSLYLPYVLLNILFLILLNPFVKLNIYSNNPKFLATPQGAQFGLINYLSITDFVRQFIKILLFNGNTQLCGATWFLRVLFIITIMYYSISYIIKHFTQKYHNLIQICISIIFLAIGYYLSHKNIYLFSSINISLSTYILFVIGTVIRSTDKLQFTKHNYIFALTSFLLLIPLTKLGSISLVENEYTNPLFLLTCSILGWVLLWSISNILINHFKSLVALIIYIGKNTLSILFLHFLSFKFVTLIQIIIYKEPTYRLASFPILYPNKIWWIAYFVVGISLPLLINKLYTISKKALKISGI